ncbi:hypothetical protein KC19_12G094900 [Ceratodon purpureus]|nr:hypothetical protein KC19_12G094900 [Ceratodon purpureus]KAG0554479.1 hypothetical protein KC19_12G094900 [Ceratodon purpureus]
MVLWVFGYGSLLWKAGFEYDERMIGYIKDYRRVFHQASTDHRGTPEYPGRVVTLEAKEGEVTWGAAYRVSGHDNEKLVLSYLDLREQEYDQKSYVNLYTADSSETPALCNVLVYIGSSEISRNKFWAGPAPLEVMAEQIARAVGPSGPNYEYLFLLEKSLRELDCVDEDISELAEAVRKYMNSSNGPNSSDDVSGTNGTTETQSISRKQQHDVCNGV